MKECIYVVEDDENIREIIDLALTSAGYTVKQYSNALDALENMKTDQVDLAVFDLMLPGISGIDAIKKIRETDQELPILILVKKKFRLQTLPIMTYQTRLPSTHASQRSKIFLFN